MSNISLIIEERPRDIGNFLVGRLLPFKDKRMVGPFAFIDHTGPARLKNNETLDLGPHPHIGLSTLTYLFEGNILHKDSLGNEIEIFPGQVNWMTAGKGIVHSERTPEYLRHSDKMLHGLQIWVALPKHLEQMEPSFSHFEDAELPIWREGEIRIKLIAGEAFGRKSPVPVYSPLYLLELKSKRKAAVGFGKSLYGESALFILQGTVEVGGELFFAKQLLVSKDSSTCEFIMSEDAIVYLFGGDAFDEPRHIYWNFVASTRELIEEAKQRWTLQEFPKIDGEEKYVPLPEEPLNFKLKK